MVQILPENFSLDRYGLHVRFVNEDDAEFILSLRTDSRLGKYINLTKNDNELQKEWTRQYKIRERLGIDYYFMFEKPIGTRLGVSRIYNIEKDSFMTGSWIFKKDAPFGSAFLGDIICHEIAYEIFPNSVNFHDTEKSNLSVLKYAEQFHPRLISDSGSSYSFVNTRENYIKYKDIYLQKLLPLVARFDKK